MGQSKRQRKHKVLGSLRSKQHAPQDDALDVFFDKESCGIDADEE